MVKTTLPPVVSYLRTRTPQPPQTTTISLSWSQHIVTVGKFSNIFILTWFSSSVHPAPPPWTDTSWIQTFPHPSVYNLDMPHYFCDRAKLCYGLGSLWWYLDSAQHTVFHWLGTWRRYWACTLGSLAWAQYILRAYIKEEHVDFNYEHFHNVFVHVDRWIGCGVESTAAK